MAITFAEATEAVLSNEVSEANAFDILAAIGRQGALGDLSLARDLLIRLLDQRRQVPISLDGLLQGLVREHGLFPYLEDILELPISDRLAYEAHRPDGTLGEHLVFHSEQALVYERLLAGENVVLSAPTSFGKSLVVDAYLDASDFRNVAVVVPTIALMDESRRRLSRLTGGYKIITHGSQARGNRNLFVMTQERLLEVRDLPAFDFFVIDEFYKLDPSHSDERSGQLNIVLDLLLRTPAQFYLLGPNITALERLSAERLRATFVSTGFTTVATDVERVNVGREELPDALAEECSRVGPETLIYCRSPARLRTVAQWLLDRDIGTTGELDGVADWLASSYHPDWIVTRAMRRGIGIHHGRLPRALGHHMVRLFNSGRLPYLLVTSTLIEGVNTSAKNVLVLDNTISSNKRYDYFTFSNIRGRSGRMLRHFVGRVVVFNPEPTRADLEVDIPVLSQSVQAAPEVLLQLPEEELTAASRLRLASITGQNVVSIDTLRANRGIAPQRQIDAGIMIAEEPEKWQSAFSWSGAYPSAEQVRNLGPLLLSLTGTGSAVRTAAQLGARVNILRFHQGDIANMARQEISRGKEVDEAMDDALDFSRNWAQFKIPTAMAAAARIVTDVVPDSDQRVMDPGVFVGALENMFQLPFVTVLEEYGLPSPTTRKLAGLLGLSNAQSLDDVLARLKVLRLERQELTPFEVEMIQDTQNSL